MVFKNSIQVLSANFQGLQNIQKCTDVLTYLKEANASIVCLQDTHWMKNDISKVKEIWGHEYYIHGNRSNARGVAILFYNKFEYEALSSFFGH